MLEKLDQGRIPALHGAVTIVRFSIRRAGADDLHFIIDLIDGAAQWLRLKDTDQWARPWPDEAGRERRILEGLATGITWLAFDGRTPAATVSITDRGNPDLWNRPGELDRPAVYLHRLAINRKYAGMDLGAALLDWAAEYGGREYGAGIVRIDVWQDNTALHSYYRKLGFRPAERKILDRFRKNHVDIRVAKEKWPSGALFERKISHHGKPKQQDHVQFDLIDEKSSEAGPLPSAPGSRPAVSTG